MMDEIEAVTMCAEWELQDLPDYAIDCPDEGDRKGLTFWQELTRRCEGLCRKYPELIGSIAEAVDRIWTLWKERRDGHEG